MKRGDKMMTTSCCPAYVRAVKKHVPALAECISETRSPMHYTAEIAKKADPDCITVFIGPCLAKRREGYDDDMVDYVLSTAELEAVFGGMKCDLRNAVIQGDCVIHASAVFGGLDIRHGVFLLS